MSGNNALQYVCAFVCACVYIILQPPISFRKIFLCVPVVLTYLVLCKVAVDQLRN